MSRAFRKFSTTLFKANLATTKSSLRPLIRQVPSSSVPTRHFSISKISASSAGISDADLKTALARELKFESEEGNCEVTAEMAEYMEKIPFKILDKAGEDEVKLVRTFGNEKVEVTFSIKDVDTTGPELVNDGEEVEDDQIPNAPVRATIDITKTGNGTITFDTIIEDGHFNIEVASYYKNEKLAVEDSAEAEWSRHALYGGPVFRDLDEELQLVFEKYLEERGITTDLALFIPNYIQYKEQLEYMKWLSQVHDFVKA